MPECTPGLRSLITDNKPRSKVAAGNPIQTLQVDETCPVFLEYLKDLVVTGCGHNFCCASINRCWDRLGTNFSCPQHTGTLPQRNFGPRKPVGMLQKWPDSRVYNQKKSPKQEKV
ncbi:unnamed protein product [Natator depressus]